MNIDMQAADQYMNDFVLHNEAWSNADDAMKKRAINNAEMLLSRQYPNRPMPDEAIFEQALWMMKISDARKQAEQGVVSYSIDGISVSLAQVDRTIAPSVHQILGRRIGQSTSGRQGWIHSQTDAVNKSIGRRTF